MDKSIFKLLVAVSLSLHAEYIRDSDKQVVLDASSGLVWQDNTLDSTLHWTTAIKTCEALELGGYSDWRLPNYSELSQLADRSKSSTAVSSMFQNTLAVTLMDKSIFKLLVFLYLRPYLGHGVACLLQLRQQQYLR